MGRRIVVAIAAVVVVAVTSRLGLWQLDRAARKEAIGAQLASHASAATVTERDLAALVPGSDPASWVGRPAALRGQWVPGSTVWLDNRQMNGRPGFFATSVLRLPGSGAGVVVQRGWVARDPADRARVPDLPMPTGEVRVLGRMAPPPTRLYDFGAVETGPLRQNLDLASHGAALGLPLLALSVLERTPAPSGSTDGLSRDWATPTVDVQKHYGYAFQWFALSALTAVLYVWFQILRPRRERR